MGRKVTWIGKPYPDIYRYALEVIGNPKRVLCIGDSAEHDVAGGRGAGLDTLLVRTGVSADATEFDPAPDYLMERFIWR
jgi:ribonucleotide monophosphatase NagD (HAD superfamily)